MKNFWYIVNVLSERRLCLSETINFMSFLGRKSEINQVQASTAEEFASLSGVPNEMVGESVVLTLKGEGEIASTEVEVIAHC